MKKRQLILAILTVLGGGLFSQSNKIIYEPLISENTITTETIQDGIGATETLAVGKSPTSHQVTPTGAFTYNVPIRIPKGTHGMEPNVSLVYNSQGGNGIVGFGWGISGLSAIGRVNKTHFHEGKVTNVLLNVNDPYSWNGNRLIPLEGGANG